MPPLLSRIRDLLRLLSGGHVRKTLGALRYRIHSNSTSLGLKRDLTVPFPAPAAKIPLEVRPLARDDELKGFDPEEPGLSADEAAWRLGQRRLLESGIRTCHVAVAPDGAICYMQWIILPDENERLGAFFGNLYPVLRPGDALLEGAFTPAAFRGQGIMSAAMALVAELAGKGGARQVITFVDETNAASMKGCLRAGFAPYVRRLETFRLFHRRVRFVPISPTEPLQPVAAADARSAA